MNGKNLELLIPAKDKFSAFAAIDCGADAVYIGAPAFGARKKACNSIEDIKEVIEYAHKYWVKVYITVNTILDDTELIEAVKLVKKLEEIKADAVIIQDMGLLNELIKTQIKIPVHMSTQCDNSSIEKVNFFNKIGVSRIILARELSLQEIQEIHKQNKNLELEAFVHGALCVSYSGQCYLSCFNGGRSANRGECAQPCRKQYSVITEDNVVIADKIHALCLKDLNLSKNIEELQNAGITSFKVEGRLKDIGYVKNITAYYSNLIKNKLSSGHSLIDFVPNLSKGFNRGFTTYFFNNRENCFNHSTPKSIGENIGTIIEVKGNSFRISGNTEINPQDGLFLNNEGCLVNKVVNGFIYPNKRLKLKKGDVVYRNFDSVFEKQVLKPTKRKIYINIEIDNNIVKITDEDGITVSKQLQHRELPNNQEKFKNLLKSQMRKTGESIFEVKKIEIRQDVYFMPISEINLIRRTLLEELVKKRVDYYENNLKKTQTKMTYTKYYKNEVDYKANIYNKSAKEFYENCGCKVLEMAFEHKIPNRQIELMTCKYCIKHALNMCKSKLNLYLVDENKTKYSLKFDCKNCRMFVMSPN